MPDINITTERGRVQVTTSGASERMMSNVKEDLGLNNSVLKAALNKLYSGNAEYRGVMLFGYSLILTPEQNDIDIDESSKIIAVANDTLRNNSSVTGTYSTSLEHKVTHSIDVAWWSSSEVTYGFSIGGEFYIKGSGHMDFTTSTGKTVSKKMSEVVGSTRQLSVTLRPGERVNASLQIRKRTVRVKVPFRVDIAGHLAGEYSRGSPITYNLKDVLKAAGKRSSHTIDAVINITCFTDADIAMHDV